MVLFTRQGPDFVLNLALFPIATGLLTSVTLPYGYSSWSNALLSSFLSLGLGGCKQMLPTATTQRSVATDADREKMLQ